MKSHFVIMCMLVFAGLVGLVWWGVGVSPASVVDYGPYQIGDFNTQDEEVVDEAEDAFPQYQNEPEPLLEYVEIIDGCRLVVDATCVRAYAEPATSSTAVSQLRVGMILPVAEVIVDASSTKWYKVRFTEWLRYPFRVIDTWYVPVSSATRLVEDAGTQELGTSTERIASTTKQIIVDRSDQKLYGYEGDELVFEEFISTGLALTPTPRGVFTIYRKTPSRYMQGPVPGISDDFYDLPGVPWNLYFTYEGAVIHGAYWHDQFGKQWSHGCVNVPLGRAEELYQWAEVGMEVVVRD